MNRCYTFVVHTLSTIRLLNKPRGWTSHQVVNWVRRQTGERRVGHTGTLDPIATGLLIVLVGRQATKRQSEFLKLDKVYEWHAQLGVTSDTYDSTGELQQAATIADLQKISDTQVEQAIRQFTGRIEQTVPAFSAIKRQGKKLYELARAGTIDLDLLPSRQVEIYQHDVETLSWQTDPHNPWSTQKLVLSGIVHVSSGTYIRSLIHDLGQSLGVGAVMTGLHRTKIGTYSVSDAELLPTD